MTMVHCEGADSDEPEQLLRKYLLHACHLSLHVQGLSTGYSKDVHGNVSERKTATPPDQAIIFYLKLMKL